MKCSLGVSSFLEEISSLPPFYCFPLFLCFVHSPLGFLFCDWFIACFFFQHCPWILLNVGVGHTRLLKKFFWMIKCPRSYVIQSPQIKKAKGEQKHLALYPLGPGWAPAATPAANLSLDWPGSPWTTGLRVAPTLELLLNEVPQQGTFITSCDWTPLSTGRILS